MVFLTLTVAYSSVSLWRVVVAPWLGHEGPRQGRGNAMEIPLHPSEMCITWLFQGVPRRQSPWRCHGLCWHCERSSMAPMAMTWHRHCVARGSHDILLALVAFLSCS